MDLLSIFASLISLCSLALGAIENTPNSPHSTSSSDFDWKSFLADATVESPVHHSRASTIDHQIAHHPKFDKTDKSYKPLTLDEEEKEKKRLSNRRQYLKRKERSQFKSPQEKLRDKLIKKRTQRKHYNNNKQIFGFTSIQNAKLNYYKRLKSDGQATDEQLQFIEKDRKTKEAFQLKKRKSKSHATTSRTRSAKDAKN